MTKKVCISGYYGFDNFGDETILKVLVDNLKTFREEPEITVFSSNPEKTSAGLDVKSVQTFNLKDVVKTVFKSDCLISGGGSLLQDITSAKSLVYYLAVIAIAKFFRKKVIIFAQGIGPINNKFLAKLTRFFLKRATYITVRDEKSLDLLKSWNVNAVKCNDPVWNIKVDSQQNTGKIGVQLRDFSTITEDFIIKLAFCLNKYYSEKEINVLSLQNKLDLEVCNKLKEHLSKINPNINVKLIENTSDEKVISDICHLDELIAMRYHACLVGVKANIKVLPINYDIKVETLANDFKLNTINIQSFDEMLGIFETFKNSTVNYNLEKINSLKFDFVELEKQI